MQRRQIYGAGIALAGVLLAVVQIIQGVQQSRRPIVFVFETVPFVLMALALAFTGGWLYRQSDLSADVPRILAWGVGSTVLFASVAALMLFSQRIALGTLEQAEFVTMNHVTVGALVGVVVGLYDAQNRQRQRELEEQRDRVETFANKAADVNNYGRALNGSDSLYEVSSLCIQGIQALLGLSQMVTVVTDGENVRIVDNTIVNVDEELLAERAGRAAEQGPATVEHRESVSTSVANHTSGLLSICLTRHNGDAIVLLAMVDSSTTLADEDMQLLELLVGHARTAIGRIDDEGALAVDPAT